MTRPLSHPLPEETQAAMAVLNDHANRCFERGRQARTEAARKKIADWLDHAEGCARRAREYEAWAAEYPKAHKHHAYYQQLADASWKKEAHAMMNIERIRDSI